MQHILPNQGDVLVAEPSSIQDLTFSRAVILLTYLDNESVVGFIVNKPLDFNLDDLIPEIDVHFNIYNGGPVEQENLYFIHDVPHLIEGSEEIKDGIYWGGSFDAVIDLIKSKQINQKNIKFFLGYSGWAPTQLMDEIHLKSWILDTTTEINNLLQTPKDGKFWQDKMKNLGGDYLLWSTAPENPNYN